MGGKEGESRNEVNEGRKEEKCKMKDWMKRRNE